MSFVFYDVLEKTSSVRVIRALHDVMTSEAPSEKALALLRKKKIIDATDTLDTIKTKAGAPMESLEDMVKDRRMRNAEGVDIDVPEKQDAGDMLNNMINIE